MRHGTHRHVDLLRMIRGSSSHWEILSAIGSLGLQDCWAAAGFVRSLVWDVLHERSPALPLDIDVVYFDASIMSPSVDEELSLQLRTLTGYEGMSVKNQARMAKRNAHRPYRSSADAMSFWPEVCTAIGVSATDRGAGLIVCAPFGTDDLLSMKVNPTSTDEVTLRLARERVKNKRWKNIWPMIHVATELCE